jgi:hypothetical protein
VAGFCRVRVSSCALAVSNMVLTITRRRGSVTEHSPNSAWDRRTGLSCLRLNRSEIPRPGTRNAQTSRQRLGRFPIRDPRSSPNGSPPSTTCMSDAGWNGTIPKLERASGIVFDPRGYPSLNPNLLTHLSDTAVTSAQCHVPVATEPDHRNYSISKGLAAAHEAFRRTQRQELLFAQTLLDELRVHIIQTDNWLFDRTPRTQLFSKFDQRGSQQVIERGTHLFVSVTAHHSTSRSRPYRSATADNQFSCTRSLICPGRSSDLVALDLILVELADWK